MRERVTGIMGAMPEEIAGITHLMTGVREQTIGMRTYYTGMLDGTRAVVVFSRWGKTAAAATVSALALEFGVTEIIFTGVAGAIHNGLAIGDIVIGNRLIQHDMDARPIMERYEIPLLGRTWFESDDTLAAAATAAAQAMVESRRLHELIPTDELKRFGISHPRVLLGAIASGDKFFAATADKEELAAALPGVLCVEMEGAAVAQVCYEYSLPFVIIRTISDVADHSSAIDFPAFISNISGKYSVEIVEGMMRAR